MKKLLLLGAVFLGSIFSANAQGTTCGAATTLVTGSTNVVPNFSGGGNPPATTVAQGCFTNAVNTETGTPTVAKAFYYKYTPTANGTITIDAGIDANPVASTDTRVRVVTYGNCVLAGTYVCATSNDDISGSDYRSRISNFPVTAGTTYLIVWDNFWSNNGFSFTFNYAAITCFVPTAFTYPASNPPTETSVSIAWTAPTTPPAPSGYQVEYGLTGFTQGSGTTVNVTTTQVDMAPLLPGTVYDFYIRSNCDAAGYSTWVGPISFNSVFPATNTPYSVGFEGEDNLDFIGWTSVRAIATGTLWDIFESTTTDASAPTYEGTGFMMAGGNAAASNAWVFTRPINVTANVAVTLKYYIRKFAFAGTGNVNNFQVTAGNDMTLAAQTTILRPLSDYTSTTYTQLTHTFTPTETGPYYIAFNYQAPAHAQANFGRLAIDNVVVTSAAGTNDVLASKFSVFPNPATNVINITNADNILVKGVQVTDLNGRTVKTVSFDGVTEAQINIADLSAGMYLVTISSDNGTMTKKIVKN